MPLKECLADRKIYREKVGRGKPGQGAMDVIQIQLLPGSTQQAAIDSFDFLTGDDVPGMKSQKDSSPLFDHDLFHAAFHLCNNRKIE